MIVTEKKTVKVVSECVVNPVFVSWLNTLGGREHWLFSRFQTKGLITQNNGQYETYISDLENSRGQINDISNNAIPLLTVIAHVDIEDIEGLKTILYSVNCELLISQSPLKWQTIRPQKGSFKLYNTNELKSTIEITFELPYINIQS